MTHGHCLVAFSNTVLLYYRVIELLLLPVSNLTLRIPHDLTRCCPISELIIFKFKIWNLICLTDLTVITTLKENLLKFLGLHRLDGN